MSSEPTGALGDLPAHSTLWVCGGLLALGIAAYWNSFDVPFVFDDLLTVQRNASVRFGDLNWNPLAARWLLYLTFTFNYMWSQQEVWSYHLVNGVLHLANGILVFFIGRQILGKLDGNARCVSLHAWLAAAIFLVHPIQTESVTYISSRSELLSTAFYLIAFLLFVKSAGKQIGLLFSLFLCIPFILGLGAKETVISLPAAFLIYDFLFISGADFKSLLARLRFYIPFVFCAAGAGYYILVIAQNGTIGAGVPGQLTPFHYFLTQLRVLVRYAGLVLLPWRQTLDYDFRPSVSVFEPAVIGSILLLGGILAAGWMFRKRQPLLSFSIFWFFLTLAPTSSIVPLPDVIFEHRLYLPMAGLCLAVPAMVELLSAHLKKSFAVRFEWRFYAAALLIVLTLMTLMRNQVWRSEVRLYQDIVAKAPFKDRGYVGLALAFSKKGDYAQATETLVRGIERIPEKRLELSEPLGDFYLKTGRFDDAIRLLKSTVDLNTDPSRRARAYNNLGVTYLWEWNSIKALNQLPPDRMTALCEQILAPAVDAFSKAVQLDPMMDFALDSLIDIAWERGSYASMEAHALDNTQHAEDFDSLYTAGKLAFLRGDFTGAHSFFLRAEKVRSDAKLLFFNDAYALSMMGQPDVAIGKYLDAIRIDPLFVQAHNNLAVLYMNRRDYGKAIENFKDVLQYDANNINSNLNLARIYAAMGNKTEARKYVSIVLKVSPGNQLAMQTWQQLGL